MVSTDPIADMLTRIRNAMAVRQHQIRLPHSLVKERVAKVLVDNHFLSEVSVIDEKPAKIMTITINPADRNPNITEIARLSKPGRRMYTNADAIPTVKRGRGIVVVSTSKGIMSGAQAKAQRLGGELICKVY